MKEGGEGEEGRDGMGDTGMCRGGYISVYWDIGKDNLQYVQYFIINIDLDGRFGLRSPKVVGEDYRSLLN